MLDQAKQFLFNNLWYGENSRRDNLHFLMMEEQLTSQVLVIPDPDRIWGPDTSHWDGNVDFFVTRLRGGHFVFIKGIDGTIRTRYFPDNRTRAIAAGLLHAPYGWLYRDINVSCVAQARAAHDLLQQYPSSLPFVIDFEWTRYGGQQANPNYSDLDKWVTEFLRLGNRKPILYSAKGFMDTLGPMPIALRAKFSRFWFANYEVVKPNLPLGFADWDFWQATASGDARFLAPGDTGKLELDLNYFNGDLQDLYALADGTIPEPPPDGGSMTNGTARENGGRTPTVRSSPGVVSGNDVRRLSPYGTIEWTELVVGTNSPDDRWFKLTDGNYVQYFYSGTYYFNIITEPAPGGDPPTDPPPATELPATMEHTAVMKDLDGNILATYKGTLVKQ